MNSKSKKKKLCVPAEVKRPHLEKVWRSNLTSKNEIHVHAYVYVVLDELR
jgi:hypothetical protein